MTLIEKAEICTEECLQDARELKASMERLKEAADRLQKMAENLVDTK